MKVAERVERMSWVRQGGHWDEIWCSTTLYQAEMSRFVELSTR